MDVKNIITFLEVADTGSFSISANNLDITQPAVSKRVAILEEQLSTRLFDRIGRRVLLTDAAEELLPLARKIAAEIDQIEERMFLLGNSVSGKLELVSSQHVATTWLPEFLKKFTLEFPDVEISLEIRPSPQLIEGIEQGLFEIGLCELPENLNTDIKSTNIFQEKLQIVVSTAHPLASISTVYTGELTSFPSILPPLASTARILIVDALRNKGFREGNTTVVPDFKTLATMVDAGLGWGVLPKKMCSTDRFKVLEMDGIDIDLRTFFLHNRNLTLSKAATAFAKSLPERAASSRTPP